MRAILAKNLSKTYWFYEKEAGISGSVKALLKGRKVLVEAVRGIDLDIKVGELIGLIGPNGAGKTTTLKMLSGILYPTEGHLEVMGFLPSRREKAFLKKITFISGQRTQLFWDLPAQEYFNFCKVVYEIPEGLYQTNLKKLVELAEIEDILRVPQRKLSFGQRKRCELVAALLHDPQVIFLDEPTNALDLINARKIREFIKRKGKEGKCSIILTSHNMSDIEQVCERVIIINAGKIVFDGSIRKLNLLDGIKKHIRVTFNDQWALDQARKLGKIIEECGFEIVLEVDSEEASTVASNIFRNFPVRDITISNVPLEQVVESIYLRNPQTKAPG